LVYTSKDGGSKMESLEDAQKVINILIGIITLTGIIGTGILWLAKLCLEKWLRDIVSNLNKANTTLNTINDTLVKHETKIDNVTEMVYGHESRIFAIELVREMRIKD
jgi:hypothetical protein